MDPLRILSIYGMHVPNLRSKELVWQGHRGSHQAQPEKQYRISLSIFQAQRVVVLGDGAEWVKNLAQMRFPEATFIIDLYHGRQHVSELCKTLFARNEKKIGQQRIRWWTDLGDGKVEKIIRQAQQHLPQDAEAKKKAEIEIHCLGKNAEYMCYAEFRAQGLFLGSGVVEAGCKTLIGQRLEQSGMEWSVRGANAIIFLRCFIKSNRFEDYWESRAP